jgi:hypothetical protein
MGYSLQWRQGAWLPGNESKSEHLQSYLVLQPEYVMQNIREEGLLTIHKIRARPGTKSGVVHSTILKIRCDRPREQYVSHIAEFIEDNQRLLVTANV